ncbi:MAG: T9SS type A sorting domain-containing protein [Fibrobacter sp.]|nr:T9SS type A sorting domain-containing protein [Fibrobacter sp.]
MRILLLLTIILFSFQQTVNASQDWKINSGGVNRDIVVTAPSGLNKPALVIAMHGMNGWHKGYQNDTKFDAIAEREKFVVVYPMGIDGAWDISGDRDIRFIEAIIDTMVKRYDVDPGRVYPTGWSMGGMMSYHLACKIPEKIAAIGPTSGYPLWGTPTCNNARPVPIIHIHGSSDGVVTYPGLHPFLESKVKAYGCPSNPVKTQPYPSTRTGSKTSLEHWGPCEVNGMTSEIKLITIDGMDHWYTTSNTGSHINESEEIWAFVSRYSISGMSGFRLTVNTTGEGSVTRSPNSYGYEENTEVTLTAVPSQGWEFNGWSGDGISGKANPLKIVMNSDKTVSALFIRSPDSEGNYVVNGDFSSGTANWTLNTWSGSATGGVTGGEYRISISSTATNNHDIQIVQPGIYLEKGKSYKVTFDAYASSERSIEVNVEMANSPWTSYLPELKQFNLTTEKQTFSFTFTMENTTDVNGRLGFNMGNSTPTVYIDNVSVKLFDMTGTVFQKTQVKRSSMVKVNLSGSVLSIESPVSLQGRHFLKVYSMKGQLVKTAVLERASGTVDLSGIPHGYYIVRIGNGKDLQYSSNIMIAQ